MPALAPALCTLYFVLTCPLYVGQMHVAHQTLSKGNKEGSPSSQVHAPNLGQGTCLPLPHVYLDTAKESLPNSDTHTLITTIPSPSTIIQTRSESGNFITIII